MLHTAYQKGVSCMDAIFATQAALLAHYREGSQPYLCPFDLEKAYDSVKRPFNLGINGKCWRFIKNWCTGSRSQVRVDCHLSDPFPVNRGVKHNLMEGIKTEHCGLSVCGTYIGAAIHADDVRTCAATKQAVANSSCLKITNAALE